MNLLIVAVILINIATLGLLVYMLSQSKKEQAKVAAAPTSPQEIQHLENQLKQSLEQLISNNNQMVQSTTNNLIKYYQDTVTTMTLNYNQNTEKLMKLLDQELKKRVEELDKKALEQIEAARVEVNTQIKKDLEDLNVKLEKYSKDKFKQVDEKIYQIVAEAAKNSVGKVISLVDHQELVMGALESAKKDKFFS